MLATSARSDRRPHATPAEGRTLGDARSPGKGDRSRDDGAWACALVDSHRRSAGAQVHPRAPRIDEGQRVGRRGRTPGVQLELEVLVVLLLIAAFPNLVQSSTV